MHNREDRLLILSFASVAVIWGLLVGLNLWQSQKTSIAQMERLTMSQIELMQVSLDSVITLTTSHMKTVVEGVESGQAIQPLISRRFQFSDHVANAAYYGPEGAQLFSTGRPTPQLPSQLGSELMNLRLHPPGEVVLHTDAVETWNPPLWFSLRTEQGGFLIVGINEHFLADMFRFVLGKEVTVILFDVDGNTISNWRPDQDEMGADLSQMMLTKGQSLLVRNDHGSVFATLQLHTYPLYLGIAFNRKMVLGQWQSRVVTEVLHLLLGLTILAILLYRVHSYRKQAWALREMEIRIRETHHRVKNNLAVVNGLLVLTARSVTEQKTNDQLHDLRSRIASIATIHEQLYQSDILSPINSLRYLRSLVEQFRATSGLDSKQMITELQIADIPLTPKNAQRLGLVVQELLTNALKYATVPGRPLIIHLVLALYAHGWECSVCDNGPGFTLPAKNESLGRILVESMASELDGTVEWGVSIPGQEGGGCVRLHGTQRLDEN